MQIKLDFKQKQNKIIENIAQYLVLDEQNQISPKQQSQKDY